MLRRFFPLPLLAALAAGCGGPPAGHPETQSGAFTIIEGAVADLCSTIEHPKYKGVRDLGTDTDRIGMALVTFKKSVEGTALAADAEEIEKKILALEKLASTRAPVDQQRAAVKELREAIEAAKAKQ